LIDFCDYRRGHLDTRHLPGGESGIEYIAHTSLSTADLAALAKKAMDLGKEKSIFICNKVLQICTLNVHCHEIFDS
jgi:hypothetical protein